MNKIRLFFAWICAILFVLSAVSGLLFFNLQRTAFSPQTYKDVFKEQGLYERAPSVIAGLMIQASHTGDEGAAMLSAFSPGQLEIVVSGLLPAEEFERLSNGILDSTFAFLNGETNTVSISLVPFKENLASEGGLKAYIQMMISQPDCSADELLQLGLGALMNDSGPILCNPPQEIMALITPLIQDELQTASLDIPDEMMLISSKNTGAFETRDNLDKLRAFMQVAPLPAFILLILLTLIAVRNLSDWLRWWGIPFIFTGVFTLLFARAGSSILGNALQTAFSKGNQDLPPVLSDFLRDVTGSLASHLLKPAATQGFLIALIGTGMLLWNKYKVVKPSGVPNKPPA